MQSGGGKYKAKSKYEYEASSKMKSKESSGKAVVPVCLPVCCAMPCVIMWTSVWNQSENSFCLLKCNMIHLLINYLLINCKQTHESDVERFVIHLNVASWTLSNVQGFHYQLYMLKWFSSSTKNKLNVISMTCAFSVYDMLIV